MKALTLTWIIAETQGHRAVQTHTQLFWFYLKTFKCQISFKKSLNIFACGSHSSRNPLLCQVPDVFEFCSEEAGGFDLPILSTQQGLEERLKVHRDGLQQQERAERRGCLYVNEWIFWAFQPFFPVLQHWCGLFPSPCSESARLGSLQTLFTTPSSVNWTVGLCGWAAHTWDKTSPSYDQLRSIFLLSPLISILVCARGLQTHPWLMLKSEMPSIKKRAKPQSDCKEAVSVHMDHIVENSHVDIQVLVI